jgi:hypothetical protein
MPGALFRVISLGVCAGLTVGFMACVNKNQDAPKAPSTLTITPRPASTPTPASQAFRRQAEQSILPKMSQPLADLVRAQPWFQEMTPAKLSLVSMVLKCEQAARQQGEPMAAMDALRLASDQGWYSDGLDDREATGLSEVFDAFALSFTKLGDATAEAVLGSTLRFRTFDVVNLPETGDKVVIIDSQDEALGRKALDIVTTYLPKIEEFAGKFPYPFIYVEVTPDFPEELYGLSYDEFIGVNSKNVDVNTLSHELTHSTVYGHFPTWFEEGLAYYIGAYMSGQLEQDARLALMDLSLLHAPNKVDIFNYHLYTEWDYLTEIRTGFLFVKSLVDVEGMDGLSQTVKSMRSKTYSDNELVSAILQLAPLDLQGQIRKLLCERIVGTTRNYCVAGA